MKAIEKVRSWAHEVKGLLSIALATVTSIITTPMLSLVGTTTLVIEVHANIPIFKKFNFN